MSPQVIEQVGLIVFQVEKKIEFLFVQVINQKMTSSNQIETIYQNEKNFKFVNILLDYEEKGC